MAKDWPGYLRRAVWRVFNPRSRSGLFLRLALAISTALWVAGALLPP